MTRILLLLLLLLPASVQAATYFVKVGGSDAASGLSDANAWASMDKVNTVLTNGTIGCGDTIAFNKNDSFTADDLSDNLKILNFACTSGSRLTITTYGSGARPIIDGTAIQASVGDNYNGYTIRDSSWITIQGLHLRKFNSYVINHGTNITIFDNEIAFSYKEAVRVKRDSAAELSTNVLIDSNVIHDCGDGGTNGECVYLGIDSGSNGGVEDTSNNITISNNEIYNCDDECIELKSGVHTITISGNYVHDSSLTTINSGAIIVQRSHTTPAVHSNVTIKNNRVENVTGTGGNCIMLVGEAWAHNNAIKGCGGRGVYVTDPTPDGYTRKVYRNTIQNAVGACFAGSGAGYSSLNNVCWGNGSGNDSSDPLINANGTLQAGSPAIDGGVADAADTLPRNSANGTTITRGAFDPPRLSQCEIGTIDATSLICTYRSNVAPPLLPATGITGYTFEEENPPATWNALAISATIRQGTNQTDSTSAAATTGRALRLSYSGGNITDSSLIGNSLNQPLLAFTNQPVTNNVGAGAPSWTLTQSHFQAYRIPFSNGALETVP